LKHFLFGAQLVVRGKVVLMIKCSFESRINQMFTPVYVLSMKQNEVLLVNKYFKKKSYKKVRVTLDTEK